MGMLASREEIISVEIGDLTVGDMEEAMAGPTPGMGV